MGDPHSLCSGMLGQCTGSSGRGLDSGAGSGSGGEGEAEVGTPRTSARRLKGKRQRSNLGQPQMKVSCHPSELEFCNCSLATLFLYKPAHYPGPSVAAPVQA